MVSTQDSESCDPSSNLGRTYCHFFPVPSLMLIEIATPGLKKHIMSILLFGPCTGPVAQRIRHLTTNQGIAGSNPARVNLLFLPITIHPLMATLALRHCTQTSLQVTRLQSTSRFKLA